MSEPSTSDEHEAVRLETFEVELPNGSDGDALVHLRFLHEGRSLLFDVGDVSRMALTDLLRVEHLFISHCHVDHFIGFDALIRPRVCREDLLTVHGPPGMIDRVGGRLSGYTWNLTDGNAMVIEVREVNERAVGQARFSSGEAFVRDDQPTLMRPNPVFADDSFTVETVALDHGIVSQAWAIQMRPRVQVQVGKVQAAGLAPGPWLARLKEAVRDAAAWDEEIELPNGGMRAVGELSDEFLEVRPGERFVYVTDAAFSPSNQENIVALAEGADLFACESPFLESEIEKAKRSCHLTARQAGELAGRAGVKRLLLFHVSPRYSDFEGHLAEAGEESGLQPIVRRSRRPAPAGSH
ncbi:MAG: ribonuclease Z [Acidobacteriota bacterium]